MPETRGKRLKRFLREGRISVATFTSAATFNNFREILGPDAEDLLRGVTIAAIGPVTRKSIEKTGLKVEIVPPEATVEAMAEAIKGHFLKSPGPDLTSPT
jgi:uroporphyrinogen III methyltransferase/synthase